MADETPDGLPGWTLGGVRKHGMRLEAACKQQRCGHFLVFDLDRLIERFGADCPLPESNLGLTCEPCGSDLRQRDEDSACRLALGS